MKKHWGVILLACVIVIILLGYAMAFTVRYQQKALVLRFGKIVRVEDEPGLKWKWPFPIDKNVNLDCRIRTYDSVVHELKTRDENTVLASVYVNWRIVDSEKFYTEFNKLQRDIVVEAESAIKSWLTTALNVFAEYNLSELVTLDKERFKLDDIEKGDAAHEGLLTRLRERAQPKFGVEIVDVGIRRLNVPDIVTKDVFDRMKADRQAEIVRLESQGASEASIIIGDAESNAVKIRAEAEARARAIEGEGDAEAARYYTTFLKHPQLATFLRQLETLRKTLSKRTTLVLDSDSAPYQLLSRPPQINEASPEEK
ncbi:MAG: protease modulator HflC [Sedimentisphaerales bacterium]|nr:protease modulator HflC [Sedimentisphaerales bacterium]